MRKILLSCTMLLSVAMSTQASAKELYDIVAPGTYFFDEVYDFQDGDTVLALMNNNGQFELKSDQIGMTSVHDPRIDGPGIENSRNVMLRNLENSKVVLMIKIQDFHDGPANTAQVDFKCMIPTNIGDLCSFQFEGTSYNLRVLNKEPRKNGQQPRPDKYTMGIVNMTTGAASEFENVNSILWVGDLDGDRKPDFIVDESDNYYTWMERSLYLSSHADTDKAIKRVGHIRGADI